MSTTLADELAVLAYDNATGRARVSRIALDLGLTAAVLIELVLHGRLAVDETVRVTDPTPTGEPVLDEVLSRIASESPHPTASWLQRLRAPVRNLVLESLVQRGVMRDQDVTELEYIHLHRYPTVDPRCEAQARQRLGEALTGHRTPDERTAALATLVASVRMEARLGLDGEAVAAAHRRLEEIAAEAGFAAGRPREDATVRPSVAFLIDALCRAVDAALGPAGGRLRRVDRT